MQQQSEQWAYSPEGPSHYEREAYGQRNKRRLASLRAFLQAQQATEQRWERARTARLD